MNHRVMTLALAASLACLASQSALAQGLRPSSGASKGLAQTPGAAAPAGKAPLALPTPSAADTGPRSADFIVAIVNSEPVTNYEVRSRIARVEQQLAQQGGNAPTPPRELIAREVLERIIQEKVQLQLAREMNLKVDDYAVNQAEAAVAQQNGLTVSELQRRLVSEGLNRDRFREELRNQLLLLRVRAREVDAKVRVSDLAIDQFIREQQGSEVSAAEINLAHVLVRVPEDASPDVVAERQARAQEAADKVRAGEDFAKVAREYSDAPEGRRDGGLLGLRPTDRYPELFVTSTQNLPVGDELVKPGQVSSTAPGGRFARCQRTAHRPRIDGARAVRGPARGHRRFQSRGRDCASPGIVQLIQPHPSHEQEKQERPGHFPRSVAGNHRPRPRGAGHRRPEPG